MSANDVMSELKEYDSIEKCELITRLHEILLRSNNHRLSPVAWAGLWLSDVDELQGIVRRADDRSTRSRTITEIGYCNSTLVTSCN